MFLSSLLLALRAIRRNLMRSFLTILGIVIGVSAVITMVTLGNGATRMVIGSDRQSRQQSGDGAPGQRLGPAGIRRARPGSRRTTPRRFKRRSAASAPSLPPPTGR